MQLTIKQLIALFAFSCLLSAPLLAQREVETTFEAVKEKCEDRPLDERVRVSVTRFDDRSYNGYYNYRHYDLGENMRSMLTNALQNINCFRVLESLHEAEDMTIEVDGIAGYSDPNSQPARGQMLGAQAVVTGEVTEFSIEDKSIGVLGVRTRSEIVRLGFIVKVINPATRDLLWSESVNVEGKSSGATSLGLSVPVLGRINMAGGSKSNPAVADALEKGVVQATEYLAEGIDDMNLPSVEDANASRTVLILDGVDYMNLRGLETSLAENDGIRSVSKSFENGIGRLFILHDGSTDELLDRIYGKISSSYSVNTVNPGEIVLIAK